MTVRFPLCVIGGGSIGQRHAEVARDLDGIDLAAVVEPSAERRAALSKMGFPVVASIDDVPERTKGAVVATPTGDHLASGTAALAQGWAVLVEKPLAGTLADADTLIAVADAAGLPLVTGHHRRCHPFSIAARARLETLGQLVAVQGLWAVRKHDSYYVEAPWRREKGAGPILSNLSHEIDLLRFISGEITEVGAMVSNTIRGHAVEDTATVTMRFASGALGTFTLTEAGASPWSFEQATGENPSFPRLGEDTLRLVTTTGALSFPSLDIWSNTGGGEIEWRRKLDRMDGPCFDTVDPLAEQMTRFAALAGGAVDEVLATGRDGRRTLSVIETIQSAADAGRVLTVKEG